MYGLLFGLTALALFWFRKAVISRKNSARIEWVTKNLSELSEVRELTADFRDKVLTREESTVTHTVTVKSKAQFDSFDARSTMRDMVSGDVAAFEKHLGTLSRKLGAGLDYRDKRRELVSRALNRHDYPESLFKSQTEWNVFVGNLFWNNSNLDPADSVVFVLRYSYTSPAGKRHYQSRYSFDLENMRKICIEARRGITYKESAVFQRSLVTPSLRFAVMKRDGYRCQICGRTQSDGVKLVVDHIKPLARGGKTTMDNLQTLCYECNSGKSDKYM